MNGTKMESVNGIQICEWNKKKSIQSGRGRVNIGYFQKKKLIGAIKEIEWCNYKHRNDAIKNKH